MCRFSNIRCERLTRKNGVATRCGPVDGGVLNPCAGAVEEPASEISIRRPQSHLQGFIPCFQCIALPDVPVWESSSHPPNPLATTKAPTRSQVIFVESELFTCARSWLLSRDALSIRKAEQTSTTNGYVNCFRCHILTTGQNITVEHNSLNILKAHYHIFQYFISILS